MDDLISFCNDQIEDYKFNIIWDSPKKAEAADSVRQSGSGISSKNGILGSSPIPNDHCQMKTIHDLCQPSKIKVKFNPSWNSANKRGWCQKATTYFRCLKSCLDQCSEQNIQNQLQPLEHYLHTQINISCPGGVDGCTRHSTDLRCITGVNQSNSNSSIFCLSYLFLQTVLQILRMF